LFAVERKAIPGSVAGDCVWAEVSTEHRNVDGDRVLRRWRRRLAPDGVDQAIDRDTAIRLEEERSEECPRPRPSQRDATAVHDRFERAQDTELYCLRRSHFLTDLGRTVVPMIRCLKTLHGR
jgi:hypothetical protein